MSKCYTLWQNLSQCCTTKPVTMQAQGPVLVALWHVRSSWTRDWTHVPCIGRWMVNHWTTREVLHSIFDEWHTLLGFPCCSAGKESACHVGDLGLVPGLGRSPWRRERLPNPVFWPGEVHGAAKSWTQLNDFRFHFTHVKNVYS